MTSSSITLASPLTTNFSTGLIFFVAIPKNGALNTTPASFSAIYGLRPKNVLTVRPPMLCPSKKQGKSGAT